MQLISEGDLDGQQLVAFLDLVHLEVTFASLVLGRDRCRDQRGVHHRAGLEQQALGGQVGVVGFP